MTGGGCLLQSCRSSIRPAWLHTAIADLEQQVQSLAFNVVPEEEDCDSFAERAENYYRKRPQLVSLLQDLHNKYLTLADRYCQLLLKHQSPIPTVHSDTDDDLNSTTTDRAISITVSNPPYPDSDAESSLSFHTPPVQVPPVKIPPSTPDAVVAEFVIKAVEAEILSHEMDILDRQRTESLRKIELQTSLLEVLESERMILLSENARLGYRAAAMAEENKGLASEAVFMKRKATELAQCVLKMRDDHRVCMLSRKIEDLQGQIFGLEKRNKEYYDQLVMREEGKKEVVKGVWVEELRSESARLKEEDALKKNGGWASLAKWWDRFKKVEFVVPFCGGGGGGRPQHGRS